MYFENDTLFQYNPKFTQLAHINLPISNAVNARIAKDRLVILTKDDLYIYQFSNPKASNSLGGYRLKFVL